MSACCPGWLSILCVHANKMLTEWQLCSPVTFGIAAADNSKCVAVTVKAVE